MSKVFIGGSRRISRLNKDVRHRLDNVMSGRLTVLIGDANGADKAVQQYLADKRYENVIVFCVGTRCRNNVGCWIVRQLNVPRGLRRDFSYFATKDRAMVDEADYGLMLWDGDSRGTLTSIADLLRHGKPVVVYFVPRKALETLRTPPDLAALLGVSGQTLLERVERDLRAAGRPALNSPGKLAGNMSLF